MRSVPRQSFVCSILNIVYMSLDPKIMPEQTLEAKHGLERYRPTPSYPADGKVLLYFAEELVKSEYNLQVTVNLGVGQE